MSQVQSDHDCNIGFRTKMLVLGEAKYQTFQELVLWLSLKLKNKDKQLLQTIPTLFDTVIPASHKMSLRLNDDVFELLPLPGRYLTKAFCIKQKQ